MCAAMQDLYNNGKSTNIQRAFRCVSVDTITSFCFAKSLNALKEPEFRAPVEQSMSLALPMVTRIKYLPLIKTFSTQCPPALLSLLQPQLVGLIRFRALLKDQVNEVTKNPEALQNAPHPVIYHALLSPTHGQKISNMSLRDEALLLVFAGTDTSSNVLTLGIMHILSKPVIHQRLRAEIREAWPSLDVKPRLEDVERLPYLVRRLNVFWVKTSHRSDTERSVERGAAHGRRSYFVYDQDRTAGRRRDHRDVDPWRGKSRFLLD